MIKTYTNVIIKTHDYCFPAMPFTCTKERLDYVDDAKYEAKQTLIEGGGIGVKLESASSHIKFEPASNGGCVCKVVATYKLLPGAAVDDEIAKAKDSITKIIKTAEAYLLANPDAYV